MSTKPTVLPQWATSPVTGGVITPSAAKQLRGWVPGERPPAQYFNWLLVNTYLWLKWLSDGDVSLNSLTVATTASITGTLGVGGVLTATGGISVPTGTSVTLNGTSTLTVGTGNTVLGGTLSVAQLATLTAGLSITTVGLSVATGCTVTLNGTSTFTVGTGATLLGGTLGVTGLATLSGGATVPTGQNVTLVGTSTLKHGTRQIQLPASAFQPRGTCVYRAVTTVSPVTLFSGAWQINGSTNALFAAVYLPVGARIINVVTLIARDSASPGGDVSTAVYVDTVGTPGGTNTSFVGTSTSLFTGIGVVNSTSPSINYTIVTNTFTGITVTSTDTAAHDHLVGVQINYDIP